MGEVGLVEIAPWEGMAGGNPKEGEGGKGGRGKVVVGWRAKGADLVSVAVGGKREGCSEKGGEVKGGGAGSGQGAGKREWGVVGRGVGLEGGRAGSEVGNRWAVG